MPIYFNTHLYFFSYISTMKKIFITTALLLSCSFINAQTEAPPPPLQEQEEIDRNNRLQNSTSFLELRNNTGKLLYASYVAYDSDESSWTSHGWYKIDPYKKITLAMGNYVGPVYVHAETQGLVNNSTWGDKWMFCIDQSNAFAIINSDKINCAKKVKFSKTQMSSGVTKWTFNP